MQDFKNFPGVAPPDPRFKGRGKGIEGRGRKGRDRDGGREEGREGKGRQGPNDNVLRGGPESEVTPLLMPPSFFVRASNFPP